MSNEKRFLLAVEGNDGAKLVMEFESEHFITGKMQAAEDLGVWCKRLTEKDLVSGDYEGAQLYDMTHHATSKIFFLEQWEHFLKKSNSNLT